MAEPSPVQRRLAAILAADVAGYSRLMDADEDVITLSSKSRANRHLTPTLSP
jgi:class 3 adenylate cyclase